MKPSVSVAISDRPVKQENLVDWANTEVQPALKQLRALANARGTARIALTTDGVGTYGRIWTSEALPTDAAWNLMATVAGMSSAAGGTARAAYAVGALVSSIAGVVTLTGSTVLNTQETSAGIDARFGVTGRTVYLEVRDAAAGAMDFVAIVDTAEVRFT